jgi:hypothetical protein
MTSASAKGDGRRPRRTPARACMDRLEIRHVGRRLQDADAATERPVPMLLRGRDHHRRYRPACLCGPSGDAMRFCVRCDNCRFVREVHPDRPWEGPRTCGCVAPGDPCPVCNRMNADGEPELPKLPEDFVVDIRSPAGQPHGLHIHDAERLDTNERSTVGGVDANNFDLPGNIKAQGSSAMRSADQDRRFDVDPVRVGNRNAKPEHPASGRWGRHSRLRLIVVGSFRLCHLRFGARGRIC